MVKDLEKSVSLISSYQEVFQTQAGKVVLRDLLKQHGMLNSTFVPGDIYATAFNEGSRTVVLRILNKMKINVKEYLKQLEQMNIEEQE